MWYGAGMIDVPVYNLNFHFLLAGAYKCFVTVHKSCYDPTCSNDFVKVLGAYTLVTFSPRHP